MFLGLSLFLVLFLGLSLYVLAPILTPFITGVVVAYLLAPIVEKLDGYGLNRTAASALPVALFFLVLTALFTIAVPLLADDAQTFIKRIPTSVKWLEEKLTGHNSVFLYLEQWGIHLTLEDVREKVMAYAGQISQFALSAAKSTALGALAVVDLISFLAITPLVMFYILLDWPRFTQSVQEMMPKHMKKQILDIFKQIDNKLSALVRGQLVVALCLGLFYGVSLSLAGLQMGFFIGMLTGVLSIIPFVGFLIGLITATIVAVLQYQFTAAEPYIVLAIIFAAGQVLESFYLTPKLLGNKVGLHPIWVIFALMAGGQILGLLGMLIALPIAIIVQVILPFIFGKWAQKVDEEMENKK